MPAGHVEYTAPDQFQSSFFFELASVVQNELISLAGKRNLESWHYRWTACPAGNGGSNTEVETSATSRARSNQPPNAPEITRGCHVSRYQLPGHLGDARCRSNPEP